MRCQQVRGFLSPYLDGVATPREVEFVETHLRTCSDCRQELENLRKLVGALGRMEQLEVPGDFIEELNMRLLRDKIEPLGLKESITRAQKPRWIALLVAGLALLAGIYVSSLVPYQYVADSFNEIPRAWFSRQETSPQLGEVTAEKAGEKTEVSGKMAAGESQIPDLPPRPVEIVSGRLEVADIQASASSLVRLASTAGGAWTVVNWKQTDSRSVIIKIPRVNREPVLENIKKIGDFSYTNIEYEDLALDIYSVQQELNRIREEKKVLQAKPVDKLTSAEVQRLRELTGREDARLRELTRLGEEANLVEINVLLVRGVNH